MPRHHESPPIELLAPVDWRPYGLVGPLFHRGDAENPVSAAAWAGAGGLFRDPIEALCGRGTVTPFGDAIKAAWAAAGGDADDITVSLHSDDRWRIENASADDLTIGPSADNTWWGFSAGGLVVAAGATVAATAEWRRGMVTNGPSSPPPRLAISREGGGTGYTTAAWHTDVVCGGRLRGSMGDLDDDKAATCLEARDLAAHGSTAGIRWGLTNDRRVFWTQRAGAAGAGNAITWLDEGFRDRLGATGDEPVGLTGAGGDAAGQVYFQIFTFQIAEALYSTWGLDENSRSFRTEGRETPMTRNGRQFIRAWRDEQRHRLQFRIDGPADGDDQHLHLLERFLPRIHRRGPFWLIQDQGDCRRAAERGGYSLFQTVEHDGYRGRVPFYLAGEIDVSVQWEDGFMSGAIIDLDVVRAPLGS